MKNILLSKGNSPDVTLGRPVIVHDYSVSFFGFTVCGTGRNSTSPLRNVTMLNGNIASLTAIHICNPFCSCSSVFFTAEISCLCHNNTSLGICPFLRWMFLMQRSYTSYITYNYTTFYITLQIFSFFSCKSVIYSWLN